MTIVRVINNLHFFPPILCPFLSPLLYLGMASFKIYEKKGKESKKGTPLIFVIYHSGKTYKLTTGLYCKAWKHESQMVDGKKDPKAPQTNNKLKKASIALQEIIDTQREFSIDLIRSAFTRYLKNPTDFKAFVPVETEVKLDRVDVYNKHTEVGKKFFMLIERLIGDHTNDWSRVYQKRFRSVRTKILKVEPNFTLEMLTEKFWRRYVSYWLEKGNISNTICSDSRTLTTLINELRKEGYVFEKGIEDKIHWKYHEPQKLGLSWVRVMKIDSLDLTDYPSPTIRDTKVLWLIGAYTGRRWAEILGMTRANFYQKDGKWRYRNIGKGQISVDIPLLKEAIDLLTSINFRIPKLRDNVVNADIKEICRKAGFDEEVLVITPLDKNRVRKVKLPLYKTVTFHTSRHSFGQHIAELAAGKPHAEKFISYMLGHASYQTSWKYMNRAASSNDQMFEEIFN